MNIYLQQILAKESGIFKEVDNELNPKENRLFCWNVVLTHKYTQLLKNMDFLAISNDLIPFVIFVPFVKNLDQNYAEFIEKYIRIGLNTLDIDKKYIDNYFAQAGKFEFGLISYINTVNKLRDKAINAYIRIYERNINKFTDQEQACEFITRKYNEQLSYQGHNKTYNEIMEETLIKLDKDKLEGIKAYELLVTLDLEVYKATRKLIVPANISFIDLNNILIRLFNWFGYHLSCFDFFETTNNEGKILLGDFTLEALPNEFNEITYLMEDYELQDFLEDFEEIYWNYDYGDGWSHKIELIKVYDNYLGTAPYLLEAHKNAPPEDVGGVGGFIEFLKTINNPEDENYEFYKSWGGKWKPDLTKGKSKPRKLMIPKRQY